jgi:type III secretory pathway component EscU
MEIVDFMVNNYQEIQALAGIILFSATAHFSYGIVQNLKEKQEYALARFFLKRKTGSSFLVISISALILSFGMALKNIGMFTGNEMYVAVALMSHILMLFGITYFTFNLYLITSPGLDHATGKENKEEASDEGKREQKEQEGSEEGSEKA